MLATVAADALTWVEDIPIFTNLAAAKYGLNFFSCPDHSADERFRSYSASEDCLTLNVLRPAGISATAKLPVLFWVSGLRLLFGVIP